MKKLRSNSGYTLAPVMVIMVLVLALTGGAIANSVLNLQAQENAVKQMQGKYEAAGKIEEVYTKLKGFSFNVKTSSGTLTFVDDVDFKTNFLSKFDLATIVKMTEIEEMNLENDLFSVSVSGQNSNGATATAKFEVSYTDNAVEDSTTKKFTHTITITSVTYKSFDVSYGGTGGGES